MSRQLGEGVKSILKIEDPISNDTLTVFYRVPTSEERVKYTASLFERERDRVKVNVTETRQQWGLKIIEGFKEGDFQRVSNGECKPMSSDPKSENYAPDWKDYLSRYAPDVLEAIATHIFEGTRISSSQGKEFTSKN